MRPVGYIKRIEAVANERKNYFQLTGREGIDDLFACRNSTKLGVRKNPVCLFETNGGLVGRATRGTYSNLSKARCTRA